MKTLNAAACYIRHLDTCVDERKLHGLLYVTQGSYIAQTGQSLFRAQPLARREGPYYAELSMQGGDMAVLSDAQRELIRIVVECYRNDAALVKLWSDAYRQGATGRIINHDEMLQFFSSPGRAVISAGVVNETPWVEVSEQEMEAEEKRWADLLERLAH